MLENNATITYFKDLYTTVTLKYSMAEKEMRKFIQKMLAINFFFLAVAVLILTVSFGLLGKLLLIAIGGYVYVQWFYTDTMKAINYLKSTEDSKPVN